MRWPARSAGTWRETRVFVIVVAAAAARLATYPYYISAYTTSRAHVNVYTLYYTLVVFFFFFCEIFGMAEYGNINKFTTNPYAFIKKYNG